MLANTHIRRWKCCHLKCVAVIVWLLTIVFPLQPTVAQSQLDAVRAAVRTPSPDSNERGGDSRDSYGHGACDACDDDGDGWEDCLGEILGPPIAFCITAPWWGPHVALDDSLEYGAFPAPYPVCWHDAPGNSSSAGNFGRGRFGNVWLEYGSDNDNLERIAGAIRLETASRWGLDAAYPHLLAIRSLAGYNRDTGFVADCSRNC